MNSWGSTLFGWRVSSWRGSFRIVARWQLKPGDQPLRNPGIFRSQIEDWGRNSPRLLPELYEAAYGHPPDSLTDRDTLIEEQIEEAFRQGLLLLVTEGTQDLKSASGGGGSSSAAPPPPPPPPPASQDSAGDSTTGDDANDEAPPPPPKKVEKTWFRAALKDEDGQPMADEDYILVDTDGVQRQGKLDGNGEVYIPPILPPGQCTISFPKIHLNPLKKKKK